MIVELKNGKRIDVRYVRHLRTLTGSPGSRSQDVDEVELPDGSRIAVQSDEIDSRQTPVECGTPDQYR